jgi:hypothetical protein
VVKTRLNKNKHKMKKRVLFILKRRHDYNQEHYSNEGLATGLYNSATFVKDMLAKKGVPSKLVVVVDNNDIDREVALFNPTHVIIEGLWVVPEKFNVLNQLHPNVKWIVRIHSNTPFLANEGVAFDWIAQYTTKSKVYVATNAKQMNKELKFYVKGRYSSTPEREQNKIIDLPNYYPKVFKSTKRPNSKDEYINVGCFGAIRPLKNHMTQAIAALKFANSINKKLRFHINTGRIEQNGQSVYNNLKAFFNTISDKGHHLVEHEWMPREEFLELCGQMDLGMQVSFSETFNIVAADFISQGVPVISSKEIPWMSRFFTTNPTNSDDISKILSRAYNQYSTNVLFNKSNLKIYSKKSEKIWSNFLVR